MVCYHVTRIKSEIIKAPKAVFFLIFHSKQSWYPSTYTNTHRYNNTCTNTRTGYTHTYTCRHTRTHTIQMCPQNRIIYQHAHLHFLVLIQNNCSPTHIPSHICTMHTHTHTCTPCTNTCTHTNTHAHTHTYIHTCIHTIQMCPCRKRISLFW